MIPAPAPDSGPSSRRSRAGAGVELSPIDVRNAGEIERGAAAFLRVPHGGLIVTVTASALIHRDLILSLAQRHRLPAVYP